MSLVNGLGQLVRVTLRHSGINARAFGMGTFLSSDRIDMPIPSFTLPVQGP